MLTKYVSRTGQLSRRGALRGGFLAGAGLAGAALLGCSSSKGAPAAPSVPKAAVAPAPPPVTERAGMPVVKGTPKKGGAWTTAGTETYTQHDPHTAVTSSEFTVIGERAWEVDEWTGKLRPNLVESWEIVDPTHYVLKLRKGITMHNVAPVSGREFDAEDLAFNLNRIAGLTAAKEGLQPTAFQRATMLSGLAKVDAVDKYTARVTMAEPVSTWFNGVTEVRNFMMPREMVTVGFKDPSKFAGMNAFQWSSESHDGVKNVFTRFDKYWKPEQPYFDRVVELALPDRSAQVAAFISKQTSLFGGPTQQEQQTIKAARPDALFYEYMGSNWQYLRFHMQRVAAFKDLRVRKAMRLAMDFQELATSYHGTGWGWVAAVHPSFPEAWPEDQVKKIPGYDVSAKARDREEAAKLMAAAGFPNGDGIAFEILNKRSAVNTENALRFQGQMAKALPGIKITQRAASDTAAFDKQQTGKDFQMITNDSTMAPDSVLESFAHFHSKGSRNYGDFQNAECDALLDKALRELNFEARKAIMNTWQQKFLDDWQPLIMEYATPVKAFLQPNIGGFDKIAGPWTGGRHTGNKPANLYLVS